MSEERTTGVIVRTRPLTETSLIVQWLTGEFGRISTVAKGARRPKSPFRGKLDLFHVAEFTFRRSRRSELHTLAEVGLRETFPPLRTDWRRLNQAAYGVALIESSTETETPLAESYEMLLGYLGRVSRSPAASNVLALELKHLREAGMLPDLEASRLSAGALELAQELLVEPWDGEAMLVSDVATVTELGRFLHGFLVYHFGRLPRGRAAAFGEG